jgi:hypothetical protein
MPTKTIAFGGWSGVDNVNSPDARTFQPPGELEKRLAALVAASDVDLDDDGWPASRKALLELIALTDPLRTVFIGGLLLVQDGGKIQRVNLGTGVLTDLVTGLDNTDPVRFHWHDNQIWWCNREYCGRITADATTLNWGMAIPPSPTLGTTTGTIPAGIYQVAATYVDSNGVESGGSKAAAVTLSSAKSITVTLTVNDSEAQYVRLYITDPDAPAQDALFWTKTVAVSALPTTITTYQGSRTPLKTQHLRGPVPGRGIFSYRNALCTFKDEWVFVQSGLSAHLFATNRDVLRLPFEIKAAQGLETGVWIATNDGMFWMTGDSVPTLRHDQKDGEQYATGSVLWPGYRVPRLQTSGQIALFCNKDGLVAGLPSGQLVPLTRDYYRPGSVAGKRVSIAYAEHEDLKQILVALTDMPAEGIDYWSVTSPYPTMVVS